MDQRTHVVGRSSRQPRHQVAGFTDEVGDFLQDNFPGLTGKSATEAIILAGYARNNEALRAAYEQGKPQIDAYLQQIDVAKALRSGGTSAIGGNRELLKGAALGAAGMFVLSWML